ncbi:hypothetical protein GCM10009554_43890 [Kribbella koreensis]|uniref:Uncharacterized protein n=1 Tax=Kribbella koreensis TaxID=57909 RepID=A0ABN1QTF0_9ACTN
MLDPEDVAAGYIARFRRPPLAKIVRSREPAHPAIVSVETFTAAQLEKRKRRTGGVVEEPAADFDEADVRASRADQVWDL